MKVVHGDVVTGIQSESEAVLSPRYMRHLWVTPDGVEVGVMQQGGNGGLGLYKSLDGGLNWQWEQDLPSSAQSVSDGVLLSDGTLLLVTSVLVNSAVEDVAFLRLDYDAAARAWSLASGTPATIYASTERDAASRATLARDSEGVLWTAFRWSDAASGNVRIRLYYSVDDGILWSPTPNLFGSANRWTEKNAKVVGTGAGIGVVVQDVRGSVTDPARSKHWAWRSDGDPRTAELTTELISVMSSAPGDPLGTHWTVAANGSGDVHLSYQDEQIHYAHFDAGTRTWSTPLALGRVTASYNSLSIAGNDDLYVFTWFAPGGTVWVKRYAQTSSQWSDWIEVSTEAHPGLVRMSSPEVVDGRLPVLYQTGDSAPYTLLHASLAT